MNCAARSLIDERRERLWTETDFTATLFEKLTGFAVIAADFDGNLLAYNEGARQIYGYAPEEVIGKLSVEAFFPDEFIAADGFDRAIRTLLQTGHLAYEGEKVRKGGGRFPAQVLFTLTKDKAGQVVGFVEIVEDLTEKKRIEAELRLHRERLESLVAERTAELSARNDQLRSEVAERSRAEARVREQAVLLDKANDAIFVRDMHDRIVYWNHSAERLFGWSRAEVAHRLADEILFKDSAGVLAEARRSTFAKGEWSGELHQAARGGGDITVQSRWTLVRDEAGGSRAVLVINSDVTETKKLEAQYLRAQRMESIGRLAGGIAHDLNNVLTPILMAVDLLKADLPVQTRLAILATLEASAARGAEMVKQVLLFARGVEGQIAPLQLALVIREVDTMLAHTLPKSVHLQTSVPKSLALVSGDATQLYQVLVNLCINARDSMPDGGRLTIVAEDVVLDERHTRAHAEVAPGAYVNVRVTDTGTGIPPEIVEKIFDPFFTTKEIGKGSGLGLSTVLGVVKKHGGFLDVRSEVGKGTCFSVFLPTLPGASLGNAAAAAPLPRGRGELVLIVDDESAAREIARLSLEAAGYQVVEAANGTEALTLYDKHRQEIGAIFIDLVMPVLDGPATIHALRAGGVRVPVIATSGLEPDLAGLGLAEADVQAFLLKPYTPAQLLRTLRQVLDRVALPGP